MIIIDMILFVCKIGLFVVVGIPLFLIGMCVLGTIGAGVLTLLATPFMHVREYFINKRIEKRRKNQC